MACMEWECTECPWVGFNNNPSQSCPDCGARCRGTFDEDIGSDYDSDRYEDHDGGDLEEDPGDDCDE